jgi:hypothetical protein
MSGVEWAKARLAETVAAFALLTRLPVGLIPVPGRVSFAVPLGPIRWRARLSV